MLTTYGLDEDVYDAPEAGAPGFLVKTDPPDHIVTAIRDHVAGDDPRSGDDPLMVRRFRTGSGPGASRPTTRQAQP